MIRKVADVVVKAAITAVPNAGHAKRVMRAMNVLIVAVASLATTQVMAADRPPVNAHNMDAVRTRPGPIVDGRHRQPTQTEITAREEAAGQSSMSIDRQSQREDREVDDLYREIMRMSATPPPR